MTLAGHILTPKGWIDGVLGFDDVVRSVAGKPSHMPRAPYILPGFVDLHVHGGGGADMMEGPDAIRTAASLHARHGTTSLLATSVTMPAAEIGAFCDAVSDSRREAAPDAARILGAHLEGPFVNPGKLGAQPPHAIAPNLDLMREWCARAPIRVVTYAPEMDPDGELADFLAAEGIRAQIGHSLCDHALARARIEAGAGVTHLYNAMTPHRHRQDGIAGAALAHADWAEIIPDLHHVEAGAILAARRAIPNLYGVTDATAGAGAPDGPFTLGGQRIEKNDGAMRLPDGTLAGSALTMDRALTNLVGIGLPLAEAAWRLSTLPADWIGEAQIGRIARGAHADLVVLDEDLVVTAVFLGGRKIKPERP